MSVGSEHRAPAAPRGENRERAVRIEYQRTLEWLYALQAAKGMDFKLERVALALQRLGDPHRRFASIHIAGTNGKGSVAAMVHAGLIASGHRAALYTSPHLLRLTERIRVGDEEIAPAEVVQLAAEVRGVTTGAGAVLTFFEFLTVMAFLHFARQRVDVAVVEVGLGGRLDATNVIDPTVAVITSIGLDHTEWLGNSIRAVAAEKGGIIKPERPVVLGETGVEAVEVLRDLAARRGAPVTEVAGLYVSRDDGTIDFRGLGWNLPRLAPALRGGYQRRNAATAVTCLAVASHRISVTEAAVRSGLASVRWPGRFEMLATPPVLTVLDGAHNPDGMRALVGELRAMLAGRRLHVLFAVMKDKGWRRMIELLGPLCRSVTTTEVMSPRGQDAAVLAAAFRAHCPAAVEPEPERAWRRARAQGSPGDVLLVTGSLFLVGAVYPLCLAEVEASAEPRGFLRP
jgi:dihydrofolate synthase/folylpolyglutamate synthase